MGVGDRLQTPGQGNGRVGEQQEGTGAAEMAFGIAYGDPPPELAHRRPCGSAGFAPAWRGNRLACAGKRNR
ncbi:hypothetical protein [Shinella sp.]|uniref:hypothetical protein n=1 Tax=Shinella sp. TaxID=1870904 RepID=UPI00301BCB26